MPQSDYCLAGNEGEPNCRDPCPGCGATIAGNDPVRGVCQARFNGPPPSPMVKFVLINKRTGEIVR